jgi:hypothetical protein
MGLRANPPFEWSLLLNYPPNVPKVIKNPARGGAEFQTSDEYCLDHSHLFNIINAQQEHQFVT